MNMKKTIVAACLAATMLSSSVFASANAKEGDVNLTVRFEGLFKEGSQAVSKRRGLGGEMEFGYFFNNNIAGVFGVGFDQFRGKSPDGTSAGVKTKNIPIKVGVQYHISNPNGFVPYFGVGYQYVNVKYSTVKGTPGTFSSKRNVQGGYGQIGFNYYSSDALAWNVDVQKSFASRHAEYTYLSNTVKIKYTPLIVALGVTVDLSN